MAKEEQNTPEEVPFPFQKENYLILIAGVFAIIIGFLLMVGGESADNAVFNPEVFSDTRITIAPLVILGGFGVVLFAIMKKPKTE